MRVVAVARVHGKKFHGLPASKSASVMGNRR